MTKCKAPKAKPTARLTPRLKQFVEAFDGNASETGRRVGMHPDYARTLLTKNHVLAAILTRDEQRPIPVTVADRHARQVFWSQVMRDVNESTAMRLRASELLGRSEADFVERHQVEHTGSLLDDLREHVARHQADQAARGVLDD